MDHKPNILLVAPSAPPKLTPESMQVARLLSVLDTKASGTLVTLPTVATGWNAYDPSLDRTYNNFSRLELRLPFHSFTSRLLSSHHFATFHEPDSLFWIAALHRQVTRTITRKPDVIYSRSCPISAAMLACKLKQTLGIPWIMHLSDPWSENPYKHTSARDQINEASCIALADGISFTTNIQAEFYQKKYPEHAAKIFITPNMMPVEVLPHIEATGNKLRLVYAGNFYGARSPAGFIKALRLLQQTRPDLMSILQVDIYGLAQGESATLLQSNTDLLTYHGQIPIEAANNAQTAADVVVSIEPEIDHPLAAGFLLCKVVDCIALKKPLLALTPAGSAAANLCAEGYGHAFRDTDTQAITSHIVKLIEAFPHSRKYYPKSLPNYFQPDSVITDLLQRMATVVGA